MDGRTEQDQPYATSPNEVCIKSEIMLGIVCSVAGEVAAGARDAIGPRLLIGGTI